jgi:tetratricopeptide (TPR) repeat protein
VGFYTQVFAGRQDELARLEDFAARPMPGYLLVEGLPAFGKSALVVQLVHRHEAGQWPGRPPALVFFLIREDGKRHTPDAFCAAVNSQLLDLLGEQGGVPPDLESQRSQLLALWSRAVQAAGPERPLLLVVDGLDEQATGEVTIADLLPGELGPHVGVLVTSRPNPAPLAQVPLEHPLRQADVLRLHALELADVEQLLRDQEATDQAALELAGRVLEVTKGEPLLARFISQDVASGGEPVLAALEQDPPDGVKDYFRRQFEQLDARAEGDTAWEVLGVLLVAHGAMTPEDLAGVLAVPVRQVYKVIAPIQRFLIGRDQVELMHLELRAVISERFSQRERQEYRRRLLAWCSSFAADGWPDDTPDYVLANYASHLYEAGDHDKLYRLLDRPWMELQAARTHSHQAFARDILLAVDAADREDPPNFVQQARGSLIYATLTSLATNVPSNLLAVLVRLGQLSRANEYASLINDPHMRTNAYQEIALVLYEQDKLTEASRAIDQALTAAQAIPDDWLKAGALTQLACALAEAGHIDQALTIVHTIRNNDSKAWALTQVARVLAEAGHPDQASVTNQALTIAQTITDDRLKARALTTLARALAQAGHPDQAVTIAQTITDDGPKAEALTEVARALAQTGHPDQALMVCARSLDIARRQGRLGFFLWLARVVAVPSCIENGVLNSLSKTILEAETWWTR